MTNFEYYQDEILKIVNKGHTVAMIDGKIRSCVGVKSCIECAFNSEKACIAGFLKWLCAEHIEKPTLTKQERAFCEGVGTGWIAADDSDNMLWYYASRPWKRSDGVSWVSDDGNRSMCIDSLHLQFDFIKPTDENPWSIEDLLKLAVEEKGD